MRSFAETRSYWTVGSHSKKFSGTNRFGLTRVKPQLTPSKQGLTLPTRIVILTAVYFLGGMIGKAGAFAGGKVGLIWPTAGIGVAAILLLGYRFLPGVAVGTVLISL